jgi:hypothetical protein
MFHDLGLNKANNKNPCRRKVLLFDFLRSRMDLAGREKVRRKENNKSDEKNKINEKN